MRRLPRFLIAAVLALALFGVARPSDALQTLTWEFVVDCANPGGANSHPFFDMPAGTYAVTIEGACTIDGLSYSWSLGTPCAVPVGGTTIPCVTGGPTVSNVPGHACWTLVNGVAVRPCGGSIVETNSCLFTVIMDGYACMTAGTVGTFFHPGGNMNARLYDTYYPDNIGTFLVTAEWTHL